MIARLGALLVIVTAVVIATFELLPRESKMKVQTILMSSEQKTLFSECEIMRSQLRDQGLASQFKNVELQIRDERLKKDPIIKDIRKCFVLSEGSPLRAEVELFSSDFGNEASADLQVQVSVFDLKSNNKISELGFRMDHEPYEKSR